MAGELTADIHDAAVQLADVHRHLVAAGLSGHIVREFVIIIGEGAGHLLDACLLHIGEVHVDGDIILLQAGYLPASALDCDIQRRGGLILQQHQSTVRQLDLSVVIDGNVRDGLLNQTVSAVVAEFIGIDPHGDSRQQSQQDVEDLPLFSLFILHRPHLRSVWHAADLQG